MSYTANDAKIALMEKIQRVVGYIPDGMGDIVSILAGPDVGPAFDEYRRKQLFEAGDDDFFEKTAEAARASWKDMFMPAFEDPKDELSYLRSRPRISRSQENRLRVLEDQLKPPCPSCDRDLSSPGVNGHVCYTYEEHRARIAANQERATMTPFNPDGQKFEFDMYVLNIDWYEVENASLIVPPTVGPFATEELARAWADINIDGALGTWEVKTMAWPHFNISDAALREKAAYERGIKDALESITKFAEEKTNGE